MELRVFFWNLPLLSFSESVSVLLSATLKRLSGLCMQDFQSAKEDACINWKMKKKKKFSQKCTLGLSWYLTPMTMIISKLEPESRSRRRRRWAKSRRRRRRKRRELIYLRLVSNSWINGCWPEPNWEKSQVHLANQNFSSLADPLFLWESHYKNNLLPPSKECLVIINQAATTSTR